MSEHYTIDVTQEDINRASKIGEDPFVEPLRRAMETTKIVTTSYDLVRRNGAPLGYLTDEMVAWRRTVKVHRSYESLRPRSFEWDTEIGHPAIRKAQAAVDKKKASASVFDALFDQAEVTIEDIF